MPTDDRLEIRPIEPADVPALLDDHRGLARANTASPSTASNCSSPRITRCTPTTSASARCTSSPCLGGEVVGGAGVAPLAGADPLTCELQRMYLRADARGRGIGDALLEHCLAAARQFLYVRCYLETVTQMQAALEFYGRHGFRDLQAPLGRTGHEHNDRWLMRPLRASAAFA